MVVHDGRFRSVGLLAGAANRSRLAGVAVMAYPVDRSGPEG
jgi:hypothetical protein